MRREYNIFKGFQTQERVQGNFFTAKFSIVSNLLLLRYFLFTSFQKSALAGNSLHQMYPILTAT